MSRFWQAFILLAFSVYSVKATYRPCCGRYEEYIYTEYEDLTCDGNDPIQCEPIKECRCKWGYVRHEGKCIKPTDCPYVCPNENEEYILTNYEDATCSNREKLTCDTVKACRCIEGYVRHNGKCIEECDCPPKCKYPNEIWVCGATYEDATCDDPQQKLCDPVDACRCKKGYVRHEGKCIREKECPAKCKCPNEIWVCGATYEDATCDDPQQKLCDPVDACRCKKGYVRHEGKCIREKECPAKCKCPNEIWVCGATYEDATCDDPQQKLCDPVDACRCQKGYVRHEGKCIEECDCPPKCKYPNEIWVCGATYEDATCDDPQQKLCDPLDACRCKKGYVRHEGKCIREKECPAKCKCPNEIWVCGATYEDATCDDPQQKLCDPVDACRCKKGYVRHEGKCIREKECPAKCKCPNEIWVCGATYEDATCDDPQQKLCDPVDACRCKKGYVRHEGKCIREKECPAKCKCPNEIWVCGATYEDATCDDPQQKLCDPVDACRCKKGYVRHEGKCIREKECPAKCKCPNEIWVCGATYEDATCDDPQQKLCDPVDACRCQKGYVRHEGKCIEECDCPPKCKYPNEIWVCGATYEDATCDDPQQKLCDPLDACRCKKGYVRHEGKCIREKKCPPKCKCPNEIWVCGATYEDATCDDPQQKLCDPVDACRCQKGYVRHEGKCIEECDCPPKCKYPNEIWVCGATYEDATCDNPQQKLCDPVDACRCKKGYVRHEGACIREKKCPPKCKCPNEIWVCGATYEDATCENPQQKLCDPVDACRCQKGYVRHEGKCIEECDCPPKCKYPNEIWVCGATYEDATCDNPQQKLCDPVDACRCKKGYVRHEGACIREKKCPPKCKCPNEIWVCGATYEDATCDDPQQKLCDPVDACRCQKGYVRHEGKCIEECDCPPKCKYPNEIWVCGATYEDATCDNPQQKLCDPVDACRCKKGYVRHEGKCFRAKECPAKCKCPNEIWVCGATYEDASCDDPQQKLCDPVDACRCKKGYVRHEGKCIREKECPAKCKYPNEIWVCGATYEDATCDDPQQKLCDPVDACRCKKGYVRHEGTCIREKKCPPKCKCPNEIWVCGATYEDATCDDPQQKLCDPVDACRCKKGYVRHEGKCIRAKECPAKCKCPNEIWVCGATYEDATCDDPQQKLCDPVDACRCKKGYVRHEGKCIREKKCPPKCKCPNEIWVCGATYEDATCDDPQQKLCNPVDACRCKKGYVRHEGACIREKKCPPKCKCPNEIWVCGATYEDATCDDPQQKLCDPVDACRCKKGYVRHEGKCIREKECPAKCKYPHEIWVPGATYVDATCENSTQGHSLPIDACRCIKGYARHNGKCIKQYDCPLKCKLPNEIWVRGSTYEDATCNEPVKKLCDPVNACRCKDGYVRLESKCIRECDCPKKCKGPNEIWVSRASYHDATCDDLKYKPCDPVDACRCKKGYVRYMNKCIRKYKCPKKCKYPNEIWICGATYEDATCDVQEQEQCEPVDACRCIKGHVRHNGKCIRKSYCPRRCKGPNEFWVSGVTYEDATCDESEKQLCDPIDACRCKHDFVRYCGKCINKCDCPE